MAASLAPWIQLPVILCCAALGALFVWQVRPPFTLDVGSPNDDPYLLNWHDAESSGDRTLTYRWSNQQSAVVIPAYGATTATLTLRLAGAPRQSAAPPAAIVDFGAGPQVVAVTAEPADYRFTVPAAAFVDGGLRVVLTTATVRPPSDNRNLGVLLDRVSVTDWAAPGGLILPPLRLALTVLLVVGLAYGISRLTSGSNLAAAAAGWGAGTVMLFFAVRSRFELGLFVPALAGVTAATAAGVALLMSLTGSLHGRFRWRASERSVRLAVLIAGLQFLVLLLGMRHPQFRSSDLMLNVHRLEAVRQGQWVFTLPLPGPRALQAPYPPAFYAAMLPFASLIDARLLVEVTAALATVSGVAFTFALAWWLTSSDRVAVSAAAAFALAPVTYEMASAGNFANLFAQGVANLYLVALVLTFERWKHPIAWLLLTTLLTVALLGHFGVFLSLLASVPLLLVGVWLTPDRASRRSQAAALSGSVVVALVIVVALYYRFHAPLFGEYARQFMRGTASVDAVPSVPFPRRLLFEWRGILANWGPVGVATGALGVVLLARLPRSPRRNLVAAWLASALLFAGIAVTVGMTVRYGLFILPPLGVAIGIAVARLVKTHRIAGPLLATMLVILWTWQSGAFWVARVLHEYH